MHKYDGRKFDDGDLDRTGCVDRGGIVFCKIWFSEFDRI